MEKHNQMIKIEDIRIIPELQVRPLDEENVGYLMAAINNGEKLPPVKLYHITDRNMENVLVSGFHRRQARTNVNHDMITCVTRRGTYQEAFEMAVKDNAGHGKQYTDIQKTEIIEKALILDPKRSNRWIARLVCSGDLKVRKIRLRLLEEGKIEQVQNVQGGDGHEYPAKPISNSSAVNLRFIVNFASQAQQGIVYDGLKKAEKETGVDKTAQLIEWIMADFLGGRKSVLNPIVMDALKKLSKETGIENISQLIELAGRASVTHLKNKPSSSIL